MNEMLLLGITAYVAGVASFFSPCIFPIIPVYLSILSEGGKRSILRTISFVAGLSLAFIGLGFGAGLLGSILYSTELRVAGGVLIIILGLFQAQLLSMPFMERTKLYRIDYEGKGLLKPFLVGLTFSLGWTPCVGPVLGSILVLAGTSGETFTSVLTLYIYMIGLATPFMIGAFMTNIFTKASTHIKPYMGTISKTGGYIMIVMGILLLSNHVMSLIL